MKKIYLITRTNDEDYESCIEWLEKIVGKNYGGIFNKIMIIAPQKGIDWEKAEKKKFVVLSSENPTSPVSLNAVLDEIEDAPNKPDYLFFISKELSEIKIEDIKELSDKLDSNKNILVAGYKFEYSKPKLENELKKYYKNGGIAYTVPWNTCAMWNYGHFERLIKKFDSISYQNPVPEFTIQVNDKSVNIELQGMEDGLAIAEATTKDKDIKYLLIDKPVKWEIESDRQQNQINKLLRKNIALTTFMVTRNYSFEALQNARIKG